MLDLEPIKADVAGGEYYGLANDTIPALIAEVERLNEVVAASTPS
jgi:hypothetical protein